MHPKVVGHIEPLAGVLRVGGAQDEPYDYAASVRYFNPKEIEILGVLDWPRRQQREDIKTICHGLGIERIHFKRIRNGKRRHRTHVLKKRA